MITENGQETMTDNQNIILFDDDGNYLKVDGGVSAQVHDDGIWSAAGSDLCSASAASVLHTDAANIRIGERVGVKVKGEYKPFTVQLGPTRLPSAHLSELHDSGFTVLEGLLDAGAVARLKADAIVQLQEQDPDAARSDGRLGIRHGLAWSTDVARAVTNPVALGLLRTYLAIDDIHYCHPPSVTTMRPTVDLLGSFPPDGWHSDYPYHPGIFPDEQWPGDRVYGVQFNICVDEFRADNAATQYAPGSHKLCQWPPAEWNEGGTRMGEGVHENVKQMLAPAGSALVYDARTWHRACDELNVSGGDRVAILNAVAPAWVLSMGGKRDGAAAYLASDMPAKLNDRERLELDRLCNAARMQPPAGVPQLQRRMAVGFSDR
jgi:hypothetical protein